MTQTDLSYVHSFRLISGQSDPDKMKESLAKVPGEKLKPILGNGGTSESSGNLRREIVQPRKAGKVF